MPVFQALAENERAMLALAEPHERDGTRRAEVSPT
jgi:hypothetical protein